MTTVSSSPYLLVCGGLNALSPLHRDCNVVDDCPGTSTLPVGLWYDGARIIWQSTDDLTLFGHPVRRDGDEHTDPGYGGDAQFAALSVFNMLVDPNDGLPAVFDYASFGAFPMHAAGAIANAYAVNGEAVRTALAVTTVQSANSVAGMSVMSVMMAPFGFMPTTAPITTFSEAGGDDVQPENPHDNDNLMIFAPIWAGHNVEAVALVKNKTDSSVLRSHPVSLHIGPPGFTLIYSGSYNDGAFDDTTEYVEVDPDSVAEWKGLRSFHVLFNDELNGE